MRVARDDIGARSRDALIAAWPEAERVVAEGIAAGRLLADPQELRPLPLAGVWNARSKSADFYAEAPCFRPLRAGRRYPAPLDVAALQLPESAPPDAADGAPDPPGR